VQRLDGSANATVRWTIVPESTTALLGSDYDTPTGALTGTLVFDADVESLPIPITLRRQGDTVADGSRTIVFVLSSPEPAGFATLRTPATAVLTITDDD
jgi:hypothetical protein